ncbi:G-type lectin S-receptor-like serine/threonine-protein kinase At4g27290 isoform X2 [Ipomoea triloba]|uniref:G-type lectin S-receptor-like serine/threonine-protein kinase At4g27290 isoform X2 n=1 Tax=Ipomoea triloba TaxID=35885 RepID=UPI00125E18DD|nr:G-type lectin S-receptor-like serine/threonine-protein kinase At4g27290 isoform X2 [Ipomoea triloba]
MGDFHLLFVLCLIFSTLKISSARDTISLDDPLHENETIISSGGTFEMGFFRPSSTSLNRYVGIWYKKIIPKKTAVWVANRKAPLSTNASSVALKILSQSQQLLALLTDTNDVVLSVNTLSSSPISLRNPVMQLLDSGNLVVRDGGEENPESFLWQSFDYPTDTYLPGMKMGINFETGHEVYLSAWKSAEDPAPSEYTSNLLVTGYPQGIIRRGKAMIYRSGPWNGVKWSGIPSPDINPIYNYDLFINKTEIYTNFSLVNESVISVLYINYTGVVHRLMWVEGMRNWITIGKLPTDDCDRYGNCGGNGLCNIGNFPVCGCLDHFLPRNQAEWGMANFAGGCGRKRSLDCQSGKDSGGFLNYSGIKLPDTQNSWYNETMTLQECQQECWKNCSCTAFSSLDVRNGGSGCLIWFGDLVDIRQMAGRGQDIFIRLAASELGFRREHRKILEIVAVTLSSVIGLFLISGLSLMLYVRRKKKTKVLRDEDFELPVFHLRTIARATNNFSVDNKLGEGGFGPVYKGVLENGQEIAVKRLSKASVQGIHEFKNEVVFIAKLQHRNLVSILGCCIQGEEQMLIYEYMPNRSLDLFIFDPTKRKLLDWPKRFNIINGIARGLMYLHQDSRLRIIHRDLKASNVLLDVDMNPKISDFGLAKSVAGNETGANTSRVVGTHGYMSPEYAVLGIFSIKSDVFSFGVSVLEIVSGMRNKGFSPEDQYHTLLGHAWKLYREGRSDDLVDYHLVVESGDLSQVLRSIHVGLLCVQQHPDDRPTMSSVVQMLSNDAVLPEPKEPGFFTQMGFTSAECSSSTPAASSLNEVSISLVDLS